MRGRAIWDKLPESIFENFEIILRVWFVPKMAWTKHVITG